MPEKRRRGRPLHPETAREVSWRILLDWERGKEPIAGLREEAIAAAPYTRPDRALIMELTQGVLRHRLILDHWIRGFLEHPDRTMPLPVLTALRLGIYQIMFLHKIPAHAAVDETVKIIKGSRFKGFASLVNAVLRRAASGSPPAAPNGETDPLGYLELVTSTPRWLVEKLVQFRGAEEVKQILQALNRPGPLALRVNTLRTDRDSLVHDLQGLGLPARPGRLSPHAVIMGTGTAPLALAPFQRGLCTVQDEGAQLIAPLLNPGHGETVIDACAAPGGKSGHLAQLTGDNGLVLAVDHSPARVRMMAKAFQRLGLASVRPVVADVRSLPNLLKAPVEMVLLDSPCSGTGVLRRHPEGKWRKDPESIAALTVLQRELLDGVLKTLAPGGKLLYTTCSLLREENEEIIDGFLERGGLTLADLRAGSGLPADLFTPRGELRTWPHLHDCDGFYAALLIKEK